MTTKEEDKLMKASVSIDWLSFTVRCEAREENGERHSSGWDDVMYIADAVLRLDMHLFEVMPYGGRHGYRKGVSFNGIEIYYDGNSTNMGANVSMSGNGCATYMQYQSMEGLLSRVHEGAAEGEINPTRLDVACDDHAGLLDVNRVLEEIENDNIRTRAMDCTGVFEIIRKGKRVQGKGKSANTIYLGSEKSETRIRIYDKAKEQKDYEGIWNRLEMVNRRDYARAVLEVLVTKGGEMGEIVAGVLADRIAFIERDDINISRCSLKAWWADFLENIKRIKLMLKEKPDLAIERLGHFFTNEMAACVYLMSEAFGDAFWQTVKDKGKQKLKRRHITALEMYKGVSA
jgi:DNA relaxase NicK